MQLKKLILFVLLLFASHSLSAQTIDNNEKVILEGTFAPLTIIKVKIYNNAYEDDIYYAFLESDSSGKWQLTQDDIDLKRVKDGELTFEVNANDEAITESYIFSRSLDKGLLLKISVSNGNEYSGDGYINADEEMSVFIDGETETNVININLKISDENNESITFSSQDITIDSNGYFRLENIDVSLLSDGKLKFVVNASDDVGNSASYSVDIVKDTLITKPMLLKRIKNNNLSNVVNKKILVASGTAEALATVYIMFTQDYVEVTESVQADESGNWELLGGDLDISVFESKDIKVTIYQEDLALNSSQSAEYTFKKFKKPIFPIVPLPIDAQKYQLIHTIDKFSDEIKSIAITDEELFIGTYEAIKVFGKSYAKFKREVEVKESWVNSLQVVNGKIFAALSSGDINVYDEITLKLLHVIKADKLSVLHLEVSGNKLISSSSDGLIKIFDIESYNNIYTLKNHQWDVGAIAINGSTIYSGSDDYSIKMWDIESGKLLKTLKSAHSGTINDIEIYDNMLISASDDKKIIIRDLNSSEIIRVLQGHKKAVNKLRITNDFLISAGSDRAIILWDMKSGEVLKRLKGHSKRIMALAVNDENIVTGSRDYKLKIWGYDDSRESLNDDDETKKPIYSLVKSFEASPKPIMALTQSDNDILVAAHGYIYFFNKVTYDYVKEYSTLDEIQKPKKVQRAKKPVAISSEDEIEYDDEEEYDSEEDEEAAEIPLTLQDIYDIEIYGNNLIASLNDSTLKIWDLETDKSVLALSGNELASTALAISTTHIFAGSKKGSVGIYDIDTKELLNLLEGHQYNVNTIAVYNEERVISAGDDYSIKIRDIETGDTILDIKNAHSDIINKIIVYENMIISASSDGTIKVRDIESGKLLKLLSSHEGAVTCLDADEVNLISGSRDKTLKVWSLNDFSLISTMNAHKDEVTDVMITDDYIISGSKDKTIKVWKYYE